MPPITGQGIFGMMELLRTFMEYRAKIKGILGVFPFFILFFSTSPLVLFSFFHSLFFPLFKGGLFLKSLLFSFYFSSLNSFIPIPFHQSFSPFYAHSTPFLFFSSFLFPSTNPLSSCFATNVFPNSLFDVTRMSGYVFACWPSTLLEALLWFSCL